MTNCYHKRAVALSLDPRCKGGKKFAIEGQLLKVTFFVAPSKGTFGHPCLQYHPRPR